MFALISGVSGLLWLALLIIAAVAALFAYRRYTAGQSTPLDPIHKGKKDTCKRKYDPAEVARTKDHPRPPILSPLVNPADPRIATLLGNVDVNVIREVLNRISGETAVTVGGRTGTIKSRNTWGTDIELAAQMLEEFYRGLGIATVREPYTVRGKKLFNVIATIPGKVTPNRVLIIGSHLDSTAGRTNGPEAVAPGADDDGSGTVACMEVAKALVQLPLDYTVRIVHFTGEEQGLYGSYFHSDNVKKANTDLVAMIQLDMVGYCGRPGNRLDIHDGANRNGSHELVAKFMANVARYGINLKVVDTHNHAVDDRSDHAGFLDHGYKAVLLSEEFTDEGFNPNYHSVNDRVKSLNLPFMAEVVKLAIATCADLAGLR